MENRKEEIQKLELIFNKVKNENTTLREENEQLEKIKELKQKNLNLNDDNNFLKSEIKTAKQEIQNLDIQWSKSQKVTQNLATEYQNELKIIF
ncbi:hypothetical protein LT335_00667 [Spiroplasma sp. JKS002669]|uniref:hypothetical protein n=1 Tax=Spiroplasma attinicola TaxID=2904537 RepID=UPI002022FCEB|nr:MULTISPECIES: hypothetical protein [unclassified Spiroplasma]MCL6429105.1 hypothetical protein [Spiroplasma sp. JKS002669]MCL8210391.1 hypothetical protein [Spiroplasma sp. JKS002671]